MTETTELRPPANTDSNLHWLKGPDIADRPDVAHYVDGGWAFTNGVWLSARDAAVNAGYHYLGPAEWREPTPLFVAEPQSDGSMKITQMRTDEAATADRIRIAQLETENLALRTERDYERARFGRAHDFGMGAQARSIEAARRANTEELRRNVESGDDAYSGLPQVARFQPLPSRAHDLGMGCRAVERSPVAAPASAALEPSPAPATHAAPLPKRAMHNP
jgi:hypothetical protein